MQRMDLSTLNCPKKHIGRHRLAFRAILTIGFTFAITKPQVVPKPAVEAKPPPPQGLAEKQSASVSAMAASVDRQKAAAQMQVGAAPPSDAFFAVSWTTPASIPPANIILP